MAALFIIAPKWKQPKCLPIGEGIKKVVCGILFSNKKEWTTGICYNMDVSQKHYDNRKKAYAKDYILHDFINMKCPEKTNL